MAALDRPYAMVSSARQALAERRISILIPQSGQLLMTPAGRLASRLTANEVPWHDSPKEALRTFCLSVFVCLALGVGIIAQADTSAHAAVLDRVMKNVTVRGQSLPETVRLMSVASGAMVRIAPDIQRCIERPATDRATHCGGDWTIYTEWGGETLAIALETLTDSAQLSFRVVDANTVEIVRRVASHQHR